MSKWYGSINNRVEENRQFCDEIKVGTGVTEYLWSDRHPYEVIAVKDQRHVTIREYDHKRPDDNKDYSYSNEWVLVSNENNRTLDLVKRGKYWYVFSECTVERAKEILSKDNNLDERLWACNNGYDLNKIVEQGKGQRKYFKMNVSFGVAEYYYDYEF